MTRLTVLVATATLALAAPSGLHKASASPAMLRRPRPRRPRPRHPVWVHARSPPRRRRQVSPRKDKRRRRERVRRRSRATATRPRPRSAPVIPTARRRARRSNPRRPATTGVGARSHRGPCGRYLVCPRALPLPGPPPQRRPRYPRPTRRQFPAGRRYVFAVFLPLAAPGTDAPDAVTIPLPPAAPRLPEFDDAEPMDDCCDAGPPWSRQLPAINLMPSRGRLRLR